MEPDDLGFDPYGMTDDEIRLQIARDNLAKYGSTIPPDGTPPIVVIVHVDGKRSRARPAKRSKALKGDINWEEAEKVCPRCSKKKKIVPDFGIVTIRDVKRPQSWCRDCRINTSYYKRR